MDYAKAKELKDAGYPMLEWWIHIPETLGREKILILRIDYVQLLVLKNGEAYILPTLEELMEECGDKFGELKKEGFLSLGQKVKWDARKIYDNCSHYGSTPKEAVTNLWLALNKK